MQIRDIHMFTTVLTIMIVIDALWTLLVLLLAIIAPAFFANTITPVASAVDGAQICFTLATMVTFAIWIHRAGSNLVAAGLDSLEFTPAARIWWFFVPLANLVKPYQGMRELWNASRSEWPYDTNPPLVGSWWALWIINGIVSRLAARVDGTAWPLTGSLIGLALAIVATLMIRGIARGQARLDGTALGEVFA